ncbi:hypothetical protein FA13DRAFT_1804563 [Coprinellus micaceus]|uniref:Uncharacterized protein n=1 Tax=Coprinellus micaceus TaxID=71717 RepID=A0A4Y7S6W9_COPMI|nr:hypothetical protein FA13DRAFT_1804563 [Coprinellus micaceus]
MSEDRWDLASLSPLTSLAGPSSPKCNGRSQPLTPSRAYDETADFTAVRSLFIARQCSTSACRRGSCEDVNSGRWQCAPQPDSIRVVAQTRAPLRIPPRQNPGRRAKKPIASRRSPSPSEDQDGYSDSGSEWKGIVEDYTGNHSVPLSRLDGISLSSFAPGMFPQFGLDHHAEDFPMGVSRAYPLKAGP